jgi:hypothetical protein
MQQLPSYPYGWGLPQWEYEPSPLKPIPESDDEKEIPKQDPKVDVDQLGENK